MHMISEEEKHELIEKTQGVKLSDIALSTRLYNCLRRNGVESLSDLMLKTEEELQEVW